MTKPAILMIAASEADSNLYYSTHFLVPDPIIYFEIAGKKYLVLSDLEIDRAKLEATVHHILSLTDIGKQLGKTSSPYPVYARVVDFIFKKKKVKKIVVPSNFPSIYFEALKKMGYSLSIKPDPFYENRLIKSTVEKNYIRQAAIQVENTLWEAVELLQKANIKKNRIYLGKELITSEFMQSFINTKLMSRNCVAHHTIVASGAQGSLPHHHGHGPLLPHTPIIFDIFPRHAKTQYWADMTRTMVKGRPTDTVKKMYSAVLEANKRAAEKLRDGVNAIVVHQAAKDTLEKHGFKTGKNKNGRMEGFIHGTGHGLGLDIHEPPSVSIRDIILKKGFVVTIEPGLYYERHGGIRLEDDHYVTASGSEVLTKFPKFFEIDKQ
ncbi:Xaa-Pro peptidase family protein [bacterium]|nr:Xaa-Pro peptidase family protein [bacterium]